jgi:hypothetical protein
MVLATILAAIRGPLSWTSILNAFIPLSRFLREPHRTRKKQCDRLNACLS